MANRESKKCFFDKEAFLYLLKLRKQNIVGIEKDKQFGYNAKTIRRAAKDGYISVPVLEKLALVLDIDPEYLTGGFKKYKELTGDYLSPQNHTYVKKLQREKIDNEYMYNKMIEFILITHDLLPKQLEELDEDTQKGFHLELERSLINIIQKYFKVSVNDRILFEIEEYFESKNTPEPPEDFFNNLEHSRFEETLTEPENVVRQNYSNEDQVKGELEVSSFQNTPKEKLDKLTALIPYMESNTLSSIMTEISNGIENNIKENELIEKYNVIASIMSVEKITSDIVKSLNANFEKNIKVELCYYEKIIKELENIMHQMSNVSRK